MVVGCVERSEYHRIVLLDTLTNLAIVALMFAAFVPAGTTLFVRRERRATAAGRSAAVATESAEYVIYCPSDTVFLSQMREGVALRAWPSAIVVRRDVAASAIRGPRR